MQLHNLKRTHKNKKTRLIGRAGQRGKTSGRGTKGQNARAGHKKRPEIRDFIKRVPKLRGRGKNLNTTIQSKPFAINLGDLNKVFKDGDIVNPETLIKAGLVRKVSGSAPKVKILATGEILKKLTIKGCEISATAKVAVEKVGGSIV
jgi:large subunit ribosomal protein L15